MRSTFHVQARPARVCFDLRPRWLRGGPHGGHPSPRSVEGGGAGDSVVVHGDLPAAGRVSRSFCLAGRPHVLLDPPEVFRVVSPSPATTPCQLPRTAIAPPPSAARRPARPATSRSWRGQTSMSPAVVYGFTLAETGTLQVTVKPANGSALQPIVHLRPLWPRSSPVRRRENLGISRPARSSSSSAATTRRPATSSRRSRSRRPPAATAWLNAGEARGPGAAVANDGCGDPGQTDACQFQPVPPSED